MAPCRANRAPHAAVGTFKQKQIQQFSHFESVKTRGKFDFLKGWLAFLPIRGSTLAAGVTLHRCWRRCARARAAQCLRSDGLHPPTHVARMMSLG